MAADARRPAKLEPGVSAEEVQTPVPGRWLSNHQGSDERVLLYLHGGAFVLRLPEGHSEMVSRLCAGMGVSAFMPWYRLAPEHPFPAALDDCLAAYQHLLERHSADNVIVMGDSAGASLTLSLLNRLKQEKLPMPRAAVALSPITDFAQVSATWLLNTRFEPLARVQPFVAPQRHYLRGENLVNPLASPIYGDLAGLPPVLLVCGGNEALRDDSIGYVRKAIAAGVDARVHLWHGMAHVHTLKASLPETPLTEAAVFKWLAECQSTPDSLSRWRNAVALYNLRPMTGRLLVTTNGDEIASFLE